MHTTQEWHQHATVNMSQAQSAHKAATRQCEVSKKAHEDTVGTNLGMYDELHKSLAQKVNNSYRLIERLVKRSESVDHSIGMQKNSLHMLDKALHDKDAPLQLCMWRLEQRERRPLREQVRDVVEVALEEEKLILVDQQRKLSEAMRRTKANILELEQNLEELRKDIDQKNQALSVDEMCLRTTQRSYQSVVERSPPTPSAGRLPTGVKQVRHQVALHESSKNELLRQQEAARMDRSAASREEAAKALREESGKLTVRCEKAAEDAAAKSEHKMQERVHSVQAMRKRLDAEMKEVVARMEHTKSTISETRYQIKSLQEPMDLTATCASWRKQRAIREHITDPVSTKLQEHRMTVLQAHQDLVGHHQLEKTNLKDLQERRERLEEDLRDKTASLQIDLACLTHEGVARMGGAKARGGPKLKSQRGMRVDNTFAHAPRSSMPAIPHTAR